MERCSPMKAAASLMIPFITCIQASTVTTFRYYLGSCKVPPELVETSTTPIPSSYTGMHTGPTTKLMGSSSTIKSHARHTTGQRAGVEGSHLGISLFKATPKLG